MTNYGSGNRVGASTGDPLVASGTRQGAWRDPRDDHRQGHQGHSTRRRIRHVAANLTPTRHTLSTISLIGNGSPRRRAPFLGHVLSEEKALVGEGKAHSVLVHPPAPARGLDGAAGLGPLLSDSGSFTKPTKKVSFAETPRGLAAR